MRKSDVIRFAGGNFLRRKARSALTVLGVVIGTAAVVIMLSIGIGMNKGFEDQINSYGNIKEIQVYELWGSYDEETGMWEQNESRAPLDDLTLADLRAINHVKAVTPTSNYYGIMIKDSTEKNTNTNIFGIDAASMADFDYEVLYGRLLDESDVGTTNFVMTFNVPFYFYEMRGGQEVWWHEPVEGEELPWNPIEHSYQFTWKWDYGSGAIDMSKPKVKLRDCKCVGILAQKKGNDYSQEIYMDVKGVMDLQKTMEENQNKYYERGDEAVVWTTNVETSSLTDSTTDRQSIYNSITVLCEDGKYVQDIEKQIRQMGYDTSSSMEWLTQLQDQTKFLRSILGAIGIVAFIVAAISIANTMVMSIYERTREIGIMKVLGCKLSDIRGMFLIEAGIIGITGGVFGVGLSYIASYAINTLAQNGNMSMMGIDAATSNLSLIPFWLDLAALVLATVVGVVSGLYPAIRATRLSALEAIKNE